MELKFANEFTEILNEELLIVEGGKVSFWEALDKAISIVEVVVAVPAGIAVGCLTANPVAGVAAGAALMYDGAKGLDND